ncbi:MAG: hypothetical protein AAGD14_13810 [Planctomycetota bacterium]
MADGARAPRVVIIGAARVLTTGNFQEPATPGVRNRFIDESDCVIRMNNIKNGGMPGLGHKTDILAMTNVGPPGLRYATRSWLDHPIVRDVPEIWFGTAAEVFGSGPEAPPVEENYAPRIVERQGWQDRDWKYIPRDVSRDMRDRLLELSPSSKLPSLGLRVIANVHADGRFADHEIYLLGFGFQGAAVHDFDAEQAAVMEFVARGRIRTMPGCPAGRWFPHKLASHVARIHWKTRHRTHWKRLSGRAAQG